MTDTIHFHTNGSSHDPHLGTRLGDYKIVDIIGQGGMGRVYKGYDEHLQRYAAVKVFDAANVVGEEMEEYRARFQREARAVARLRHPNIVDIYQFGQASTLHYMAMSLVNGRDLRTILKENASQGQHTAPAHLLRILTDVASALDYAHAQGVIHRDIKPSNIMVMPDGHAVLTDFGLALNVPEGTIGTTFGSAHYIAPEQAMNSSMAVPQSDLYSLGVVLFEMLTGKVPFNDQSPMNIALKHLSEAPPSPRLYNSEISPELEQVVLRTLEKEPENRFPTGEALIQALEKALGIVDEDEDTRAVVTPEWGNVAEKLMEKIQDREAEQAKEDDDSTIIPVPLSASKPRVQSKPVPEKPAPKNRKRFLLAGGIAVLLVAVFIVGGGGGSNTITASVTPAGSVVLGMDETEEATEEPTSTATASPVPPTATSTPTAEITEEPTATATPIPPSPAASAAPVELIFDDITLVLYNRSDEPVDLSGITFVQEVEDGRTVSFSARRWSGGTAPINALPAGDCFQLWTTEVLEQPVPEDCTNRHKWDQSSFPRWFWINDDPDTVFDVRRGGDVLAQCRIGDGTCQIAP